MSIACQGSIPLTTTQHTPPPATPHHTTPPGSLVGAERQCRDVGDGGPCSAAEGPSEVTGRNPSTCWRRQRRMGTCVWYRLFHKSDSQLGPKKNNFIGSRFLKPQGEGGKKTVKMSVCDPSLEKQNRNAQSQRRKRNTHRRPGSGAIHARGSKDDDGAGEGGNEVTEGPKELCPISGVPVSHGLAGVWGLGRCWCFAASGVRFLCKLAGKAGKFRVQTKPL